MDSSQEGYDTYRGGFWNYFSMGISFLFLLASIAFPYIVIEALLKYNQFQQFIEEGTELHQVHHFCGD